MGRPYYPGSQSFGPRRDYVSPIMAQLAAMNRMQATNALTESAIANREDLIAKRREEMRAKAEKDEREEAERRFQDVTGLTPGPDTQQYVEQIRKDIRAPRTEKLPEGPGDAGLPSDVSPNIVTLTRPGRKDDAVRPETSRKVIADIKQRALSKADALGLTKPNHPNYDPDITAMMNLDKPLVTPEKLEGKAKELSELRAARGKEKQEVVKGNIAAETQQDYIENYRSQVRSQFLKEYTDREKAIWEPQKQQMEATLRERELALKDAEIARQPAIAEKLKMEIANIRGEITKRAEDMQIRHDVMALGEAYSKLPPGHPDKRILAEKIAALQGKTIDLAHFDENQANEAVKFDMSAASEATKMMSTLSADATNVTGVYNHAHAINTARLRSATIRGDNVVDLYTVRTMPPSPLKPFGKETAAVFLTRVSKTYAIAKMAGTLNDALNAEPAPGKSLREIEKGRAAQGDLLINKIIDENPELKGNFMALQEKIMQYQGNEAVKKAALDRFVSTMRTLQESTKPVPPVEPAPPAINLPTLHPAQPEYTAPPVGTENAKKAPPEKASTTLRPKVPKMAAEAETPKEISGPATAPESEFFNQTKAKAIEVFKSGKRFDKVQGTTFEEWIAEQAHRSGRSPEELTPQALATYWKLWSKHN